MRIALVVGSELCALILWLRYLGTKHPFLLPLGLHIVCAVVVEVIGGWTSYYGIQNTALYNLYIPVEFALLAWIGTIAEVKGKLFLRIGFCVVVIVWLAEVTAAGILARWCSWSVVVGGLVMTSWFLWLLWWHVQETTEKLMKTTEFWIFIAMVVYYGASAPVVVTTNALSARYPQAAMNLFQILQILCAMRYLTLGYACTFMDRSLPSNAGRG